MDSASIASPTAPAAKSLSPWAAVLLGMGAVTCWLALYLSLGRIAGWLTYSVLGLAKGKHVSSAVEFLVFEVPKVLLLLTAVVFAVGISRSPLPPPGAPAPDPGRPPRVGRYGAGGSARRGHAVLLLLGGPPLPRVRYGGGGGPRGGLPPHLRAGGGR